MALPEHIYEALGSIVGPDHITQEPATLYTYAFQRALELYTAEHTKFFHKPEAVLLPGSTEEVQAIVRTCNRFGVKYHALSTGWIHTAGPLTEGVVQLDLRRMDRILEIDEKNQYAVIEPYVIAAQLQAEAMKVGLNTFMIGAGAGCSPLAQLTSFMGNGPMSLYMGHASENLLAAEWVLPNGDIARTGSLGSGCGWFCGEGPGPSARALIRGKAGAQGGMGVFTKVGIKLYPWPGPSVLPVEGPPPAYTSPLPEFHRAHTVAFPSWQAMADSYNKLYDSEIGYVVHRQFQKLGADLGPAFWLMYTDPTKTLDDMEEIAADPEVKRLTEEMRISYQIVLAGQTPNDIEYQEKVLDEILAETGGHKVSKWEERDKEEFSLLYMTRWGHKNLNFVYGGGYRGSFHQEGPPDYVIQYAQVAKDLMKKYQDTGLMVQSGGDALMGPISGMGGGGWCSFEQFTAYDVTDKESIDCVERYFRAAIAASKARGWSTAFDIAGDLLRANKEQREAIWRGMKQRLIPYYQYRVKQLLDPNEVGDSLFTYAVLDKPEDD
ncbi:MAG: FAD-binding oxidoreductase [Desulfobacteraceae bacterium]|nr:MAG: FAD-binding oxidoreductase [Desulfobacteraceae bacterium]